MNCEYCKDTGIDPDNVTSTKELPCPACQRPVDRVVITPNFGKGDRVEETKHKPGFRNSGTVREGGFDELWQCFVVLVDWDKSVAPSWVRESYVMAL